MSGYIGWLIDLPFVPAILVKATVLLALAWLVHFALRGRNPRWRVVLWRAVFAGLIALPVAEWALPAIEIALNEPPLQQLAQEPNVQTPPIEFMEPVGSAPAPASPPRSSESAQPDPSFSLSTWMADHGRRLAAAVWAVVAAALLGAMLQAWFRVRKALREAAPAPDDIVDCARGIAHGLGVRRRVDIRLLHGLGSPFLAGILRPVIVLPATSAGEHDPERMRAVLAHELAHAKTHDPFWMALSRIAVSALWFHPLMWWVRPAHNAACEEVCDGVAAAHLGSAESYSKVLAREALALLNAEPAPGGVPMLGTAEIVRRLRKIESGIRANPLARRWVAAMLLLGAISLAGLGSVRLVTAQREAAPAPETAIGQDEHDVAEELRGQPWWGAVERTYGLRAGEALRRIPPPRISEMEEYFRARGKSRRPTILFLYWDTLRESANADAAPRDLNLLQNETFRYSNEDREGVRLGHLPAVLTDLTAAEYRVAESIRDVEIEGDWSVAADASTAAKMEALQTILREETGRPIAVWQEDQELTVVVATGDYDYEPIPDAPTRDGFSEGLFLYGDELGGKEIAFSSGRDLERVFELLSRYTFVPVINEAKQPPMPQTSGGIYVMPSARMQRGEAETPDGARRLSKLLDNLAAQTGLEFRTERRTRTVWHVAVEQSEQAAASDDIAASETALAEEARDQAPAGAWRARFEEVYRFDEDQVLKRIAPPFIPERADYYRAEHPSQAAAISRPPDYFTFHWDGELTNWGLGFSGGSRSLSGVIILSLGISRGRFEGSDDILNMPVPGDWIVRPSADPQALLDALAEILREDLDVNLRFERQPLRRTVVVVSGSYDFSPLENAPFAPNSVHIFSEGFNDGSGGGTGTFSRFLDHLGNYLGYRFLNESEVPDDTEVVWRNHRSAHLSDMEQTDEDTPELLNEVLQNLRAQTGLKFTAEEREIDLWVATTGG